MVPIEQIKARLQVQYELKKGVEPTYKGPIDCMIKLIKNNGIIGGLYKGFVPTILTRSGSSAYFGGQEYASLYFKNRHPNKPLTNMEQFLTGGFAGTWY